MGTFGKGPSVVTPETPEPATVVDLITSSGPPPKQTLRLPPEVWERAIGWIPYYPDPGWFCDSPLSRSTLLACTLVCRSWLHKSQQLLLPTVMLTNANKANSFLTVMRNSPSLGQLVECLVIGPLEQDSDGTSKPPCFYNWIYNLLNTLPPLLPNIDELMLQNLPTMHKSFFVLAPQFKTVTDLYLTGLVNQSFSQIIKLVNHFPNLQKLGLRECQWKQPAHYYSGIQHKLQKFEIETDSNCDLNGPKWLSASHSTVALKQLWLYDVVNSGLIMELDEILKQCTSTLQILRVSLTNDSSLIPSSLLIFEVVFSNFFEEVFESQNQSIWEMIDTIVSDSKLKTLGHFVIWTKSKQVDNFQKERVDISEKVLSKLFEKDILWWGDIDTNIAYHISSHDERSLTWDQLTRDVSWDDP